MWSCLVVLVDIHHVQQEHGLSEVCHGSPENGRKPYNSHILEQEPAHVKPKSLWRSKVIYIVSRYLKCVSFLSGCMFFSFKITINLANFNLRKAVSCTPSALLCQNWRWSAGRAGFLGILQCLELAWRCCSSVKWNLPFNVSFLAFVSGSCLKLFSPIWNILRQWSNLTCTYSCKRCWLKFNHLVSLEPKGTPQCHPPQEIKPYEGTINQLTIWFPLIKPY